LTSRAHWQAERFEKALADDETEFGTRHPIIDDGFVTDGVGRFFWMI